MKYLFYSLLIYWVYQRFFAPLINNASQPPQEPQAKDPPPRKNTETPKKDIGEFIDYEEVE